ncbi:MAG TPA: hypothetical protein VHA52_01100 [Candidatus Babeliaceae bacterium]|nr:hypothetical protein [Candidatus Babeliaceae bacterium]
MRRNVNRLVVAAIHLLQVRVQVLLPLLRHLHLPVRRRNLMENVKENQKGAIYTVYLARLHLRRRQYLMTE